MRTGPLGGKTIFSIFRNVFLFQKNQLQSAFPLKRPKRCSAASKIPAKIVLSSFLPENLISKTLLFFLLGQQLPCGSTPIQQSRVIGGQDAKPGAWPWQVLSPFFFLVYSLQIDCIIPFGITDITWSYPNFYSLNQQDSNIFFYACFWLHRSNSNGLGALFAGVRWYLPPGLWLPHTV